MKRYNHHNRNHTVQSNSGTTTVTQPCAKCGCTQTVQGDGTDTHYARLECQECHRFIKWLPFPQNEEERAERLATINELLASPFLVGWEWELLRSFRERKKLSPKQLELLEQIEERINQAGKGGAS